MNFIKLIHKIKENKRNIILYFMFFIIFFSFTDISFAADKSVDSLIDKTSTIAEFFLKGISLLLALITYLATIFLSPTWINGSLFGLNVYFKEIWILVSNVVYFIFAFILIWIAFMNIIGKNSDQYQLKQALPKFIVGVIIVPFSWFLVQFILSISAVLTVASLSLPFDTFDEFSSSLENVKVPINCELNLNSFMADDQKQGSNKQDGFISCSEEGKIPITSIAGKGDSISSIFGIISMYTYGVLSLDTIDDVDSFDLKNVKTMLDLIVKIVFDLLFVIIYSILMITLGLVLMIRGIYIWIYMMLSPVFGLMYFFGKSNGGEGFFAKFNIKEFIALAMVPVYTMLALSFGLLFLFVVGAGISGSSKVSSDNEVSVKDDVIKVGDFSLKIVGQVSKLENITEFGKSIGGVGLGIVGSLILKIFGIVVLWGTIMAAMRTSEITKQITQPIYDLGASVGKVMMSAPGNMPIFGGQSMQSMNTMGQRASQFYSSRESERGTKFLKDHGLFQDGYGDQQKNTNESKTVTSAGQTKNLIEKSLKDMNGNTHQLTTENYKELLDNIANNNSSGANNKFREYMNGLKDKNSLTKNEAAKALLLLEDTNIDLDFNKGRSVGVGSEADVIKYIENLKNKSNNDTPSTGSSDTSTPSTGSSNTNINVTIKNNKIDTFDGINLANDKQTAIKELEINKFTKDNFIKELQETKIGLNESDAKKIADKIDLSNYKTIPNPNP
ncbi:MAG: hypothetical protein Q8K30_03060 [Candidatus Gracilibacteria bacterium]|nr:hypothetical protein [Candidatus Gracilibacteria bacterium]